MWPFFFSFSEALVVVVVVATPIMDPKKFPTPNATDDEPFAKTVNIELDSGDELTESSVCYCPNLPPRPVPKKKGKTVDTVVTTGTNIDPSPPERVVSSTDSPPLKKPKTENDDRPCEDCECSPCILDQGLYDLLSEGGLLRDDDNYDIHSMRKQIRYDSHVPESKPFHLRFPREG